MREPWDIDLPADENDTDLPAEIETNLAPEAIRLNAPRKRKKVRPKSKAAATPPKQAEREETMTTELRQPEAPALPRLATLMQVARSLCVSPHTVRAWIRTGRLRPVRICRRLLFHPDEITRFVNSQY